LTEVTVVLAPDPVVVRLVTQGPQGPRGLAPLVPRYALVQVSPDVDGLLTLDVAAAATVHVLLDKDVTEIAFDNWPTSAEGQRFVVYFQQDGAGGHVVLAWPANILWPAGTVPQLTLSAGAIDSVVFDTFDGGTTILGTPAAFEYAAAP
jgi:hypothetical protein